MPPLLRFGLCNPINAKANAANGWYWFNSHFALPVYDENGDWTGDGISKYYKLGAEIDKAAYDWIFVDFDISQMDDTSCFSENGLSFTKEEILAYLETEAAAEAISQ